MQTPTPAAAADLQAAVKKALHSASFAKFMTGAMAAALAETREIPDGIHLASGVGRFSTSCREFDEAAVIDSKSGDLKHSFYLQREYCPSRPARMGAWYGQEYRTDEQGRVWHRSLGDHVVDDFGTLVPVTGGAA